MIAEPIDDHLDLYFEQCSILVSARDLAVMAATVANNGVNPLTGVRAIETRYIKYVLPSCTVAAMYDYSGEWSLPYRPAGQELASAAALSPLCLGNWVSEPIRRSSTTKATAVEAFRYAKIFPSASSCICLASAQPPRTVRSTYRGDTMRSKLCAAKPSKKLLTVGARRLRLRAPGQSFFATMERLLRQLDADIATASYLIFDFKRVLEMDDCARALLEQLNGTLAAQGKNLFWRI
jgi:glutaminase